MQVKPYLSFDGRCEEAIRFYQAVLGAEILMLHFGRRIGMTLRKSG